METKYAYGYTYSIFWNENKKLYEARISGVKLPNIQAFTKTETITRMEAQIKQYRLETDKDILPLLKLTQRPSLKEIGPLARARGITDVSKFWEFVERVQSLWAEWRSMDAEWDVP